MKPKRIRGQLTDADIFELLIAGEIRVCVLTARVIKGGRELKVIERTHLHGPDRGTYRFVCVCANNARKKIAVHRLVVMAFTGAMIPDEHDVDHIFGSDVGDELWNLRILPAAENRRLGQEKAKANKLDDEPF